MNKCKIGIAGLGRPGKVHAKNIAFKISGAELTAACSIVPEELDFARSELGISNVFSDYRKMLQEADIDAVCIVTTSKEHCWQIEAALDSGRHVFSEKPLGVNVAQCKQAEAAVERHPELTFMLGFMRRYDFSLIWPFTILTCADEALLFMTALNQQLSLTLLLKRGNPVNQSRLRELLCGIMTSVLSQVWDFSSWLGGSGAKTKRRMISHLEYVQSRKRSFRYRSYRLVQ